jgi:hypothetical protein
MNGNSWSKTDTRRSAISRSPTVRSGTTTAPLSGCSRGPRKPPGKY